MQFKGEIHLNLATGLVMILMGLEIHFREHLALRSVWVKIVRFCHKTVKSAIQCIDNFSGIDNISVFGCCKY